MEEDCIKKIVGHSLNLSLIHHTIGPMSISTDMYFHAIEYKASLSNWKMQQKKCEELLKKKL